MNGFGNEIAAMAGEQRYSALGVANVLTRNWWIMALRGLAAVAFGVVAFVRHEITLRDFIDVFGIFAVLNGGLALTAASNAPRFGVLMGVGVINIVAGLLALAAPGMTPITFLILLGFWAIASGFGEIAAGIRLGREIPRQWWTMAAGIVSLVLGAILIRWPLPTFLTLTRCVGAWAVAFGLSMSGLALQLRRYNRNVPGEAAAARA